MWMKRYTAKLMNPLDESWFRRSRWYERLWMKCALLKSWLLVNVERWKDGKKFISWL